MISDNALKKNYIDGLIWKFLENFGVQFVNFVIQIVLARILLPEDYGVIAKTSVFILIANIIIQTGFSSAIIQKKEVSLIEYSSVFYSGIASSLIIYIILFVTSPFIANFYNEPVLTSILRVQSIAVIIASFSSVQNAILIKNLQFKKSFIYRLIAIFFQGVVGIILAIYGYGVWALVYATLVNTIIMTVSMWFVVKWKPQLIFSFKKIKKLFSFSSKILIINLINQIYNNIKTLIIGKEFDSETLGYYYKGNQFPTLIMTNTDGAMNAVIFPVLSKCQNDKAKLLSVLRRSLKTSCFIIFPMMLGLIAIAKPLTVLLLTEKWLPIVPFIQLTCLICMTWPFSINNQAYNAMGRSDISLKLNFIGKAIGIIFMIFTLKYGVYYFVIGFYISSLISLLIGCITIKSVLDYKLLYQLKDIITSLLLSIIMAVIVYLAGMITNVIILKLILQVSIGIIFYIGIAWLFKFEAFNYLLNTFKELKIKKKTQETD